MKRLITPVLSAITFVYTLWYMHFGVAYKNSGALSKIGLTHHTEFVVWGVLTFATLAVGIIIAYRRYTDTKVFIPLLVVSAVGMALTLCFDFDYSIKSDYYFHCIGSLAFSVVMGVTIFALFLLCYNKSRIFAVFTYLTGAILVVDLVCLLIFKETGLIEALPIFSGFLLLSITNLRRDKVEAIR